MPEQADVKELVDAQGRVTRFERTGEYSWRVTKDGAPMDWLAVIDAGSCKKTRAA